MILLIVIAIQLINSVLYRFVNNEKIGYVTEYVH